MDYHFYTNDLVQRHSSGGFKYLSFIKTFLPVFVLAFTLPLFLFFALNQNQINLVSQANQSQALRIWFEPASIAAKPKEMISVDIMVETVNQEDEIYYLSFPIISDNKSTSISPPKITHNQSFAGRLKIGSVEITPEDTGKFAIQIPESEIIVGQKNIKIETAPLQLFVTP